MITLMIAAPLAASMPAFRPVGASLLGSRIPGTYDPASSRRRLLLCVDCSDSCAFGPGPVLHMRVASNPSSAPPLLPAAREHVRDGAQQDLQVVPERPVHDVEVVELD